MSPLLHIRFLFHAGSSGERQPPQLELERPSRAYRTLLACSLNHVTGIPAPGPRDTLAEPKPRSALGSVALVRSLAIVEVQVAIEISPQLVHALVLSLP